MTFKIEAYHGTTADVVEKLEVSRGFKESERDGLWLGTGAYFFESAPNQALSWAVNAAADRGLEPVVIRAEIELNTYLDFSDRTYWSDLQLLYEDMRQNGEIRSQIGPLSLFVARLRRYENFGHNLVDHDVVNRYVLSLEESDEHDIKIDGIRCPFVRGKAIYDDSWFYTGSCIMVSVRNLGCIKSWDVV